MLGDTVLLRKEEAQETPGIIVKQINNTLVLLGRTYILTFFYLDFGSNYNYGPAGAAIGSDLLANPDLVATDATISFKTALWFWMTPQSPKPSSHDVITGRWTPSEADSAAGRVPGYGVITNIINGGIECGKGSTTQQEDRIGFYKHYSDILGVGYGDNLDCNNQRPFNA
ncbi:hypothetical protein C3L33_23357, partial [Rhododendron williamsianum]